MPPLYHPTLTSKMTNHTPNNSVAKIESIAAHNQPDIQDGNVEDLRKDAAIDDNLLLAQGHVPVLNRSFDLLGTLGLGFRYSPPVSRRRSKIYLLSI